MKNFANLKLLLEKLLSAPKQDTNDVTSTTAKCSITNIESKSDLCVHWKGFKRFMYIKWPWKSTYYNIWAILYVPFAVPGISADFVSVLAPDGS